MPFKSGNLENGNTSKATRTRAYSASYAQKMKGKERAGNPAIPSMLLNQSAISQAPFASSLDPVSVADTSITVPQSSFENSLNLATYQGPPPSVSPPHEQTGLHLAMQQHSSMAANQSSATLPAEVGPFLFCAIAPVMPSSPSGVSEVVSAGPQSAGYWETLDLPSTQQHPLLLATARQPLLSSGQLAPSEYQSLLQTQFAPVAALPPSTLLMATADPSAALSVPFLVANDAFAGISGLRCGSNAYLVGSSSVHPSLQTSVAGITQIQLQQLQPPATPLLPLVPTGDSAMTSSPSSMGFASIKKTAQSLKTFLGNVGGERRPIPDNGTSVLYTVHQPNTAIRCKGESQMVLGLEDKGKEVRQRNLSIRAKSDKLKATLAKEEADRAAKMESSSAYFCTERTCTAVFQRQRNLIQHLQLTAQDPSKHWFGQSNVMKYTASKAPVVRGGPGAKRDAMINATEEALHQISGVGLQPETMQQRAADVTAQQVQIDQASYIDIDGVPISFPNAVKPGFAMRGAGKIKVPKRRKAPKFQFIAWLHSKGEKGISGPGAGKISAEVGANIMRLVGTQEGENMFPNDPYMQRTLHGNPRFLLVQLLHPSQIKSYMGKPNATLQALYQKFLEKEANEYFGDDELETDSEDENEED